MFLRTFMILRGWIPKMLVTSLTLIWSYQSVKLRLVKYSTCYFWKTFFIVCDPVFCSDWTTFSFFLVLSLHPVCLVTSQLVRILRRTSTAFTAVRQPTTWALDTTGSPSLPLWLPVWLPVWLRVRLVPVLLLHRRPPTFTQQHALNFNKEKVSWTLFKLIPLWWPHYLDGKQCIFLTLYIQRTQPLCFLSHKFLIFPPAHCWYSQLYFSLFKDGCWRESWLCGPTENYKSKKLSFRKPQYLHPVFQAIKTHLALFVLLYFLLNAAFLDSTTANVCVFRKRCGSCWDLNGPKLYRRNSSRFFYFKKSHFIFSWYIV